MSEGERGREREREGEREREREREKERERERGIYIGKQQGVIKFQGMSQLVSRS